MTDSLKVMDSAAFSLCMENNIPIIVEDQAAMGRTISWMKVLTEVSGEFPNRALEAILPILFSPSIHVHGLFLVLREYQ